MSKLFQLFFGSKIKTTVSLLSVFVLVFVLYSRFFTGKREFQSAIAQRKTLKQEVSASGRLRVKTQVTLHFPAPGKLSWIKYEEGEKVMKGQAVLGMDTTELNAQSTAAWYNFLAADANAKQIEDSLQGHDRDETFEQRNTRIGAQTARDKAWDAYIVSKKMLDDANLISPIDGVISSISVTVPMADVSMQDGVTIIDPDTLFFEAEVDEIDFSLIKVGQKVEVNLDAFTDSIFSGKVRDIAPIGTESPGGGVSVLVEIELNSTNQYLIPGFNGEADFVVKEVANALVIPREFIKLKGGRRVVSILDGNNIVDVPVEVGISTSEETQIMSGISDGEEVVLTEG